MRTALNQKRENLKSLLHELDIEDVDTLFDERVIAKQRENLIVLQNKLSKIDSERAKLALSLLDTYVEKSVSING